MFARSLPVILRSFFSSVTFAGMILLSPLFFSGLSTVYGQTSANDHSIKGNQVPPPENGKSFSIQVDRAAAKIPGNVNIFLSINDADATLRMLEKTPVNDGIRAFYDRSNGGLLWKQLARRIGLTPEDLFNILVSRQLVFTARYEPRTTTTDPPDRRTKGHENGKGERGKASEDSAEKQIEAATEKSIADINSSDPHGKSGTGGSESSWVILAQTPREDFRRILTGSNAEVVRWAGQAPIYGSKREESLDMAYSSGMAALAPQSSGSLLDEIITNGFTTALSDKPSFVRSMKNGTGSIVFFARHPQWKKKFTKGSDERWISINMSIDEDGVRIRSLHHQPSEKSDRPADTLDTEKTIDLSPLDFINSGTLSVIVERFTDEPASSFGSSSITAPFVEQQPSILKFTGPTMFTIVSARDVPRPDTTDHAEVVSQLQHIMRTGKQELTVVWGIELRGSPEAGSVMMNELFLDGLNALKACVDHPQRLSIPKTAPANPGKIQSVDLTRCARQVLNVLPGNDNLNLYWGTVRGKDISWWLCATDLDAFNETRRSLKTLVPNRATSTRSSAGIISGPAVASLLDSWEEVNSKTTHPIFSRLFYVEELLKGIPRIRWSVIDDDNNITTTDIRIDW